MSRQLTSKRAFTLIEILVTMAIISVGVLGIFRVYIVSLNRMSSLTQRIYAHIYLNNRIERIDRSLKMYKALPFESSSKHHINMGSRVAEIENKIHISEVEDFTNLFAIDVTASWKEGNRRSQVVRSAYISDFGFLDAL